MSGTYFKITYLYDGVLLKTAHYLRCNEVTNFRSVLLIFNDNNMVNIM